MCWGMGGNEGGGPAGVSDPLSTASSLSDMQRAFIMSSCDIAGIDFSKFCFIHLTVLQLKSPKLKPES